MNLMKKKILVIAPQSYPVTGAEAIVNTKMLQAMARSKCFEVDLVSKKNKWQNYKSDTIDKLNLNLNSLHIIEVENKINFRTFFQHILSILLFGAVFKGSHWAVATLPIVKKMIKENNYDYVLTKDAPSLLLGYYLKKHYGIKWVATWNDPYPGEKYPKPYGKGWNSKESLLIKRLIGIMRYADWHIFPSVNLRNYMLKYLNIKLDSTLILPHVVFSDTTTTPLTRRKNKLRIIHSGNIRSPRNPKPLLIALNRLSQEFSDMNLEITFQGVFDESLKSTVDQLDLISFVKFEKAISYSESLLALKDYDIALIIEADCEEGIFLPTKVSDFMQCGIPIFAVSPQIGVLKDLFLKSHISYFAAVSNQDEIYRELKRLYKDFLTNNISKSEINIPRHFTENYIIEQYLKL